MLAPPTAHMNPEFFLQRGQATLQGADHARGDARGMPIHAHNGSKRLEPEGMREPTQEFVAAIVVNNRLANDRAQASHTTCQPFWYVPAMQRQISTSRFAAHEFLASRAFAVGRPGVARLPPRWLERLCARPIR